MASEEANPVRPGPSCSCNISTAIGVVRASPVILFLQGSQILRLSELDTVSMPSGGLRPDPLAVELNTVKSRLYCKYPLYHDFISRHGKCWPGTGFWNPPAGFPVMKVAQPCTEQKAIRNCQRGYG